MTQVALEAVFDQLAAARNTPVHISVGDTLRALHAIIPVAITPQLFMLIENVAVAQDAGIGHLVASAHSEDRLRHLQQSQGIQRCIVCCLGAESRRQVFFAQRRPPLNLPTDKVKHCN